MRVACRISKVTRVQAQAHSLAHPRTPTHALTRRNMLFHGNNGFVNAPHCYVVRTLPVLLFTLCVLYLMPKETENILQGFLNITRLLATHDNTEKR